jgi:hypothetical protein
MARKDDILKSFLTHELLDTKYQLKKEDLPTTIRDAINSNIPIIKAIALIIDGLEVFPPVTDSVLRNQVTQLLNNVAI